MSRISIVVTMLMLPGVRAESGVEAVVGRSAIAFEALVPDADGSARYAIRVVASSQGTNPLGGRMYGGWYSANVSDLWNCAAWQVQSGALAAAAYRRESEGVVVISLTLPNVGFTQVRLTAVQQPLPASGLGFGGGCGSGDGQHSWQFDGNALNSTLASLTGTAGEKQLIFGEPGFAYISEAIEGITRSDM